MTDVNKRYRLNLISDNLFHFSKEFVLRPGKRIRPLLFILAYKGYKGKKSKDPKNLYRCAASIELLHDFMLIHDDVIDNSDLRRGKPTLHRLFEHKIKTSQDPHIGKSLAIVAGDILFSVAIEAFLTIKENMARKELALKKLVETAAYTGCGEFLDVIFGHKKINTFSEEMVFLNYTLKTAKYTFECPLLMGALLAGAGKNDLKNISTLGICAGQAFQIYDDILDLFSTQEIIGKPILTDLAESKKTLLVLKAYNTLKGKDKKLFVTILEKSNKTNADLESFRKLIIKSGSYNFVLKKLTSLQKKAHQACQRLKMEPQHKKAIEDVIAKLSPTQMPLNLTAQLHNK
ncbi:MAG: polyprenyl synthetase family protein [Candidatus Omnitrophota bacterium]